MGPADAVPLDEAMEGGSPASGGNGAPGSGPGVRYQLIVALATSVGLFLFTRILIPDAILTLTVALALWGLLRAIEDGEAHPARWALLMWGSIGTGLLLKGLVAAAFPVAAGLLYLGFTKQL